MLARATILAGAPDSPVVLHVPACSPTPSTPNHDFSGHHAASTTDLLVRAVRRHATLCPHAILNRAPQNVIAPPPRDLDRVPTRDYNLVCAQHAKVTGPFRHPADPYTQLVNDIVAERLAATGVARIIELHWVPTASPSDLPVQIVLGIDDRQTPQRFIAAAARAFGDYDVAKSVVPESTDAMTFDPRVERISITVRTTDGDPMSSTRNLDDFGSAIAALCAAESGQRRSTDRPIVRSADTRSRSL